jgi:hypothetical protein
MTSFAPVRRIDERPPILFDALLGSRANPKEHIA